MGGIKWVEPGSELHTNIPERKATTCRTRSKQFLNGNFRVPALKVSEVGELVDILHQR